MQASRNFIKSIGKHLHTHKINKSITRQARSIKSRFVKLEKAFKLLTYFNCKKKTKAKLIFFASLSLNNNDVKLSNGC